MAVRRENGFIICRRSRLHQSDCGFLAVQLVLAHFFGIANMPTLHTLRSHLQSLGYPLSPTGTSSFHLAWLLRERNLSVRVCCSSDAAREIWPHFNQTPPYVLDEMMVRRGPWANSARIAASILARERAAFAGNPSWPGAISVAPGVAVILRVDSSSFYQDADDPSAHFLAALPSADGLYFSDGYGDETALRAAEFDWSRWIGDAIWVSLRNDCPASFNFECNPILASKADVC